jgi:hypothetical protein
VFSHLVADSEGPRGSVLTEIVDLIQVMVRRSVARFDDPMTVVMLGGLRPDPRP